jgi:uncharacterized protein YidB (DUF937 family)
MGLLDDIKGMTSEAAGSGGAPGGGTEGAISGLLGQGGSALPGLLEKFGAGGLGPVAQSWVGKGANLPVSGAQIKSILGSDVVASVAAKLGLSPEAAADKIAQVLPGVIDKLTPDGIVPDPGALADKLTGLIKGL